MTLPKLTTLTDEQINVLIGPAVGTILNSGNFSTPHMWEVVSNSGKTMQLCELIWSPDMVNEKGCVYRTPHTIRVKVRPNGIICHRAYGSFELRQHPVTVIKSPILPTCAPRGDLGASSKGSACGNGGAE